MLGKVKTFIKNCVKEVIAEQQQQQTKDTKPKLKHRDFGADISSMELKQKNAKELLGLSFQKTIKDFKATKLVTAQDGKTTVAEDSAATYKDMAFPEIQPGTAKDIVFTFFSKFGFIGWQLCAVLSQHWLISNACSIPAKDAIRNGWQNTFADKDKEDENEDKEKEQKFLNELNEITNTKFKLSAKAIQWITKYNIFGIGIALPIIDGMDLEAPYNPDGIKKGAFKGIAIIDPYWIVPDFDQDVMNNPTNPDFYEPTYYRVMQGGKFQRIHKSHFIIAKRKEVPDILKPTYYFGGVPLTQEIYERVYAAEKSANEQPLLLLTKRLNCWKIDLEQFFTDPEKYADRIKNFTEYRDNQGILLIDHEDDVSQLDTTLSDLDQVVMSQYKLVAAVARIPVDKLFELNPSGSLSNSGDYNIKNYNQDLNTMQNDLFKPFIDRINEIVMRSYYGKKDAISIVFNPTDNPTASELAESVKTETDTMQGLISTGVITTEEARQKLISNKNNGYSFLDEELPEQDQDNEEIAQMMAEMKGGNKQNNNNNGSEQQNIPPKQQQAQKQPIPQAQSKDSAAEDTDWITVHPHGNKDHKGQPVPVEEGQGKGEAIKQHFARAAAGETHMYNDNDDDDDLDFSFNPEVIEEQEELEKRDKELQKEHKKEAAKAKREQKKWEKMSEEEKEAERNEWYEAESKREKQAKKEMPQKTLPEAKRELEELGITGMRKPSKEGYGKERWEEYNALSPRIKRAFFPDRTDDNTALKWDEANKILEDNEHIKEKDIFEYLRVIDIKTPLSRTNERTRNYLKGEQAEDSKNHWENQPRNKGKWATSNGLTSEEKKRIEEFKQKTKKLAEEKLKNSKPLVRIIGNEFKGNTIEEKRENAKQYYKDNFENETFTNKKWNRDIKVLNADKTFSQTASEDKINTFKYLDKMLENAEYVTSGEDTKHRPNVKEWHYLATKITTNKNGQDNDEIVIFSVREDNNGNIYYNHTINEKEVGAVSSQDSCSCTPAPTSKNTLTYKNKNVKCYFVGTDEE